VELCRYILHNAAVCCRINILFAWTRSQTVAATCSKYFKLTSNVLLLLRQADYLVSNGDASLGKRKYFIRRLKSGGQKMSQIPGSFVRNIYVMCIKYTFHLHNLDVTPNKYRAEPQRAKCSKEHYSFLFSRHVFSWRTDSTDEWKWKAAKSDYTNLDSVLQDAVTFNTT
jgi:hypothetical protein